MRPDYRDGQPVVVLKGVTLMGVLLPNAGLCEIKNIDLVWEFGGEAGFRKSFADGVDHIRFSEAGARSSSRSSALPACRAIL